MALDQRPQLPPREIEGVPAMAEIILSLKLDHGIDYSGLIPKGETAPNLDIGISSNRVGLGGRDG